MLHRKAHVHLTEKQKHQLFGDGPEQPLWGRKINGLTYWFDSSDALELPLMEWVHLVERHNHWLTQHADRLFGEASTLYCALELIGHKVPRRIFFLGCGDCKWAATPFFWLDHLDVWSHFCYATWETRKEYDQAQHGSPFDFYLAQIFLKTGHYKELLTFLQELAQDPSTIKYPWYDQLLETAWLLR
jgi:hypothetical protein